MAMWIAVASAALIGGIGVRLGYQRWRRRTIAARRVVEKPNSFYASQGVRALEDRERWGAIELSELHPLNREEVARLLDAVAREGVEVLTQRDRVFLDSLAR